MITELFTRKNMEILVFLSHNSMHIRDIAAELEISPAKVHNAVQLFKRYDLVTETKKKNMKIIQLNLDSLLWKRIKQLIEMDHDMDQSDKPEKHIKGHNSGGKK